MTERLPMLPPPDAAGPAVIYIDDMFHPERYRLDRVDRPMTVREYLAARNIEEFGLPTMCVQNGEPVLRAEWAATVIDRDAPVVFVTLPGKGGGGGSSPGRIIAMVAVMVAAVVAAQAVGAALVANGTFAAGSMGLGIAQGIVGGVVMFAGQALVGAMMPPPTPATPTAIWSNPDGPAAPSPTYTLGRHGNTARPGQPIPAIYGQMTAWPDLACQDYTEYNNNEQYYCALYCIGVGGYQIDAIKIDDTLIANYDEAQYRVVEPGEAITLVDPNVSVADEVGGLDLRGANKVPEGQDGWAGPFVPAPIGTTTTAIGVDIVFSYGLYKQNKTTGNLETATASWTVEARPIDDDGVPTGGWATLGSETFAASTTTPQRRSYRYAVAAGRYEVRAKRTNDESTDTYTRDACSWGGMRAYLTGAVDTTNVTWLELKIKASNNLNSQTFRRLNVAVTRKLPAWDSQTATWSAPQPTRAIAWAVADVLRNQAYGGQLEDFRLDLARLAALHAEWEAAGDYCDAVFDTPTTVWDVVTEMLRGGLAMPIQELGMFTFNRDVRQASVVMALSASEIVKGSFQLTYLTPNEDTADAVTVEYWNARASAPRTVECKLADSQADRPARIKLRTVTGQAQAQRVGMHLARTNRYRRVIASFQTEMEGMVLRPGHRIMVSFPLPRWGQSGDVAAWDPETGVLTLTELPAWTELATHHIALRRRNGTLAGPFAVTPHADDPYRVVVDGDLGFTPYAGGQEERASYMFGPGQEWGRPCLVLTTRPRGRLVDLRVVVDDDRAYP